MHPAWRWSAADIIIPAMDKFAHLELGKTDEAVVIDTVDHHRAAAVRMVQQARFNVEIVSRLLDPPVYDTPEFVDAVTNLILARRQVRIRILVFDPLTIVQRGHRLVDLGGKLSTFIEFRKPGEEHLNFNGSLLMVDAKGYILRESAERYEGTVNFHDRTVSKNLLEAFEEMWARAGADPNLRRMIL
jgi:hypothetical protein